MNKIKELRLAKKLSQQALADLIEMKQQRVGEWEIGKYKPNVDSLIKLSKALDCDINDLI